MILKVKDENGQFKEVVLKGLKGDKGDRGEDGTVLQQKEIDDIKSSLDNIMIMIEKNTNDIKKLMENNNTPSEPSEPSDPTIEIDWKGKTATFYGDSLTEINGHYTKGYHQWIKEILELDSYINYGQSGFALSHIYNKVNDVTDNSDLIIIMGGVNDQTHSMPLGTIDDNTTSTTYGSMNLLCSKLKEKYPTKTILFITPHVQTKYKHNNGITSVEISNAIIEVCNKYSIPVYDNCTLGGINIDNLSTYTTDYCHWNDAGHEMIGKKIAEFINNKFEHTEEPPNTEEPPDTEEPPVEEPPVVGPPFDGTKITINKSRSANLVHFVALCSKESNFNLNDIVKFSLNIDEPDGIDKLECADVFADNTGEVSNSAYTGLISQLGVIEVNNNNYVGTYTINKDSNSTYVKIPFKITINKIPSSFKINSIGIKCNDEDIDILKIGGFFTEEQMTITKID